MEALGISLGYLIVYICSFAIVFIVLRAWVFQPMTRMLEKRRQTIAQGLEDARIAAEARANAEKDAEHILAEAQAKAAQIVREATVRAEKAEEEIRAEAESEVAASRKAALAELDGERNRLLAEVREEVVTLAIAAAQKLLGENLDEKRQRALVSEFFSGVKGGRVVVLEAAGRVDGHQVEVLSALPLTCEEQIAIQQDVICRLGGPVAVNFRVDPSILGGLILRVGDRVLDGSVAGQLEELHQTLR